VFVAVHLEHVVRREPVVLKQDLLDLRREHVDAADDQHVVAAPGDARHPAHGARRAGQELGEIARPEADHGHADFGERGQHQLAVPALGQHGAGLRIDDLG